MLRRYLSWPALLLAAVALSQPALTAEEEAGHMHGPDGRHIAIAGSMGEGSGPSILSHHDLMITDTRQPGPKNEGVVVKGCDVHSVIYRKGDPQAVIHREHNAFEPENGVYGSHMMYKEPGEYVIVEKITMPGGKGYTLEFPIWVPDPHPAKASGLSPVVLGVGAAAALLLIAGAFAMGHRSGRQAAALLSAVALLAGLLPATPARAEEEEGHMHGPDGRHIAVASKFGAVREPLRAYPTPDRKEFAVQTRDHYRFRLSIENEELAPPDPNVVSLSPAAATAIGLKVAVASGKALAGGIATTGRVRPNPNGMVTVSSRVGGRVVRVSVTPGQRVPRGMVLAVVDSTEIAEAQAARTRAQAEERQADASRRQAAAGVRRAQSQLAEAQAGLERARADAGVARRRAENLRRVLERQRQLAEAGAFSQGPVEEARAGVAATEGELRQAQEALTLNESAARRLEQGMRDGVVARRELEAAQTAAAQSRARVATAQSRLEITRATLTREDRIQRENLRNAREVQQAEADAEAAQLAVRSAEAVVTSQGRSVQAQRAAIEAARGEAAATEAALQGARLAVRSALDRLRLLGAVPGGGNQVAIATPISGEVGARPVSAGEVVAAGQTLCTLLNAATLWVESDVFEKDLPRVRVGQRVAIAADAVPGRTFEGTINYVGGEVNPETRAIRVRTVVSNPGEVLKPNMFVRVIIASGSGRTVTVPEAAVQEETGEHLVFVEEAPGTYRRRAVRAGTTLGDQVVIQSGLKPGERVVTQGAYQLLARVRQG